MLFAGLRDVISMKLRDLFSVRNSRRHRENNMEKQHKNKKSRPRVFLVISSLT